MTETEMIKALVVLIPLGAIVISAWFGWVLERAEEILNEDEEDYKFDESEDEAA